MYQTQSNRVLTFLLICGLYLGTFAQEVEEFRAVKVTNVDSDVLFSDQNISEGMDYLASIGINTILVVVWNSHDADGTYTLYPSQIMENYFGQSIHPAFHNRDPLKRVIIEAHRNGMEVFPWFEMGFSTSYSLNGGHIITSYPDWALEDRNGNLVIKNGFDWMSAINPEVQELMLSLTLEVVDTYDIDGIEYSDRIPAMPVEGGYDSVTVAIFRDEHDGSPPPFDYTNPDWMRWRANKLTDFFTTVRDSVKYRSENLIVSSSPSLFPWSYEEYLQDSKTWVEDGIADNIIPQVYRQTYQEYLFELDKSLNNFPNYRHLYYSGMLIKLGSYIIDPSFFLDCLQTNRDRQIKGEAFFFYEGLRANQNLLGDTLKSTFYQQSALLPERNGTIWRPKADIVNETDNGVTITGNWEPSDIAGFADGVLLHSGSQPAGISYTFDINHSAFYDAFVYNVTGPLASDNTPVTLYAKDDSLITFINQADAAYGGWQPIGTAYLEHGTQKVVTLSNKNVPEEKIIVADAVMLMINRKKSPDVIITNLNEKSNQAVSAPEKLKSLQIFPNPFNMATTIIYHLNKPCHVNLSIFNLHGQKIITLRDQRQAAGRYHVQWKATALASGIYICCLNTDSGKIQNRKLILLK